MRSVKDYLSQVAGCGFQEVLNVGPELSLENTGSSAEVFLKSVQTYVPRHLRQTASSPPPEASLQLEKGTKDIERQKIKFPS